MPAYENSTVDSLPAPRAREASPCPFKAQRTVTRPEPAGLADALWQMILPEPHALTQAAQRYAGQEAQQGGTQYPRISEPPSTEVTEETPEASAHDAFGDPASTEGQSYDFSGP